jgi:hypothetical protein
MEQIAAFAAPACTIIASLIVASNLGAKITGWGFVIYLIGAIMWLLLGYSTGQTSLLVANGVLFFINILGVWRWLGRQASYEEGREVAAKRSARAPTSTLVASSALVGGSVKAKDGTALGSVVDVMLRCDERDLAYVVAARGATVGMGEDLVALQPDLVRLTPDGIDWLAPATQFERLAPMQSDRWLAETPDRSGKPAGRPAFDATPARQS